MFQDGKIRAVGLSNFTTTHTNALRAWLPMPIVSHQSEFSALELGALLDGILDQAIEHDMAVLAWSPLGGGRLGDSQDTRSVAVAAALDAKAQCAGVSRIAAAYSWIMTHPARPVPIVGTQNVARIARSHARGDRRSPSSHIWATDIADRGRRERRRDHVFINDDRR